MAQKMHTHRMASVAPICSTSNARCDSCGGAILQGTSDATHHETLGLHSAKTPRQKQQLTGASVPDGAAHNVCRLLSWYCCFTRDSVRLSCNDLQCSHLQPRRQVGPVQAKQVQSHRHHAAAQEAECQHPEKHDLHDGLAAPGHLQQPLLLRDMRQTFTMRRACLPLNTHCLFSARPRHDCSVVDVTEWPCGCVMHDVAPT